MNKKLQFFVVVIILLIFGLSCSYASNQTDDTADDAISTDVPKTDNVITKTTESDVKTATSEVTNYASLSAELTDNSETKTVNMKKGTYTITNPITILEKSYTKTITINGNGAVIDGSNSKTFLTINPNNKVTINNLVIKNTKSAKNAAGIVANNKVQLTLNNCTFINNVATEKGGALLNRGTTVVNGCVFNSNTAGQGGAIWSTGEYGGSITIQNSKFVSNKASSTNNYDKTGVIYLVSGKTDKIVSNTFENNNGRLIHNFKNTLEVSKNTFKNTNVNVPGKTIRGALIDNYEANIKITDNIFDQITVSASSVRGGILYNEIGTSSFTNNKISNFKATGTAAKESIMGGIIFNRNSTLTVSDNTYDNTNNGPSIRGGVLYNNIATATVTSNIFKTKNTATTEIRGGAIYNDNAEKASVLNHGGNDFKSIVNKGNVINSTIYNLGIVKEIKVEKSTVITVKDVHGIVGNNILLIANVNDVSGNKVTGGTLVFKINGKTVSNKISVKNGLATAAIVATKSYNNGNLSASYGGTTGFKANSTAKNGIVSLSLRNAKVTVTASPSSAKQYETIVFTAKVVDSATGKAISDNSKAVAVFKINGKSIKNSLNNVIKFQIKNGVATFNYAVPKGMAGYTVNGSVRYYDVTACVSHPDYNTIDRATTKFTVQRSNISLTTTTLVANMTSKKLTIKANVKDYKGNNVLGTTKLNIKINGKTVPINNVTTTTFNNGVIDLVMDLPQVSSLNSIMFVIGERCSYESLRETITDITKVK